MCSMLPPFNAKQVSENFILKQINLKKWEYVWHLSINYSNIQDKKSIIISCYLWRHIYRRYETIAQISDRIFI